MDLNNLNNLLKNPMKFIKDINKLKNIVNILDSETLLIETSMDPDKLQILNESIPNFKFNVEKHVNELEVMLNLSGTNKTKRDIQNLTGKFIYLLSKYMWCLYLTDKLSFDKLREFYFSLFGINIDEKKGNILTRLSNNDYFNLGYIFNLGNTYGYGYGYGYGNIDDIQIKNKYFNPEYLNNLSIKNTSDKKKSPLKGIDKVYIINLKGSSRESHMRTQLKKIGLDESNEGIKWDFVRPLNIGIGDSTIKEIQDKNLLPYNIDEISTELKTSDGKIRVGTLSLSLITYYLFTLSIKNNEVYLILEDNIIFVDDFVNKYNSFYDNLPNDNWNILDLHSFNNLPYDNMCKDYYEIKKKTLKIKNSVAVPSSSSLIDNSIRLKINNKVLLGCSEGAGTKGYVIKPTSSLFIQSLPIKNPSDGIKNWISGYWKNGISYVPAEELIKISDTLESDRRNVDDGNTTFKKLDKSTVDDIFNTLSQFNNIQKSYLYKLYETFNRSARKKYIDELKGKVNCNNLSITFTYHDFTKLLCNTSKNKTANILETHLKKYYNKFDINKFYKLNPSIVNLSDTKILMCYRIYLGELECNDFTLDDCHPWKKMWQSSIYEYNKPISKLNFVGLARINLQNMSIEEDIILNLDDEPLGLEDTRLFEENGFIYLNGSITVGTADKGLGEWKDNRILRQGIVKIGSQNELIQKLPFELKYINLNCIESHNDIIEKNWFGYKKNGKHILINPTFGNFFPLKQFNLEVNNLIPLNDQFKENHYENYKNIKAAKCTSIGAINENNLIENLNDRYSNVVKDGKKLFRLSGGSWGIDISNNETLFIGHIIAYIDELDKDKVIKYVNSNNNSIISNNLYHLLFNRQHQLTFFGKTMRYFQIFFVIDKTTNKLTKLSHGFSIFENKDNETSVNFPIGLVKINNDILISFGESDYKTVIVKMNLTEVNKLLNVKDNNMSNLMLLSYDKNTSIVCYKDDTEYKKKYLKYKEKYLQLKSELDRKKLV